MNGNEGLGIDTKGQVVQMEQVCNPVIIRIRPDMNIGVVSKQHIDMKLGNNCWLCEGWSIVEFKFDPSKDNTILGSNLPLSDQIICFVHLSIDDYNGDLMSRC
jgi:hypothetical protein